MRYNVLILSAAERYLGLEEWPGSRQNPQILEFFAESGHSWVQDDETPWCAAFVNAILGEVGLKGTGRLNARSFLDWGVPVEQMAAQPGDICVLWRGSPDGPYGHVAPLVQMASGKVLLRGGNQGNTVSDEWYPMHRVIGFRRAVGEDAAGRLTLRSGMMGLQVEDLQRQLRGLGYHLGAIDGVFGPITERAVFAFQRRNSLTVDGVVGRNTWRALDSNPLPAPTRNVSTKVLRARGSDEIKTADRVQVAEVAKTVTAAGATGTLYAQLEAQKGELEKLSAGVEATGTLSDLWPYISLLFAVALIGLAVYSFIQAQRIKQAKTRNAQAGADLEL